MQHRLCEELANFVAYGTGVVMRNKYKHQIIEESPFFMPLAEAQKLSFIDDAIQH